MWSETELIQIKFVLNTRRSLWYEELNMLLLCLNGCSTAVLQYAERNLRMLNIESKPERKSTLALHPKEGKRQTDTISIPNKAP